MGLKNIFKKSDQSKDQPKKKTAKKEVEKKEVKKPVVSASKESVPTQSTKSKINKENTGDAYRILVKPLITEKVTELGAFNQYAFAVSRDANKAEVKKAIKKVYGVEPIRVNIMNVAGRKVRWGRTTGKTVGWKKAIVFLNPNDKIEVIDGT